MVIKDEVWLWIELDAHCLVFKIINLPGVLYIVFASTSIYAKVPAIVPIPDEHAVDVIIPTDRCDFIVSLFSQNITFSLENAPLVACLESIASILPLPNTIPGLIPNHLKNSTNIIVGSTSSFELLIIS